MQTTRVCSVSDLDSNLRMMIGDSLVPNDPVQYCVEGTSTDSGTSPFRTAIVLTGRRILYADSEGIAKSVGYTYVTGVEEKQSRNGKYFYIEIFAPGVVGDSIRFDFESPDKVHSFRTTLKKLGNV